MKENADLNLPKIIGLLAGPFCFVLLYFLPYEFINTEADKVIAVALWMILWWLTEAVSISVTALIPIVFFPLLGIEEMQDVGANYGSPIVFLFLGGFIIALALEKVKLHKRFALKIIGITGSSPDRVLLGFMISTAFMSMWISNTASTVVMLPIALSVINLLINDEDGFTKMDQRFALKIMLGIAFSANAGGIATLIGTPPNIVLAGFMEENYNVEISFLKWMAMGIPFMLVLLFIIYQVLSRIFFPTPGLKLNNAKNLIEDELSKLGKTSTAEKQVITCFLFTIALWLSKDQLNDMQKAINFSNAGISMLGAFLLFTLPVLSDRKNFILRWEDTRKLPWGIIILFGGGLALATALKNVGVIDLIGTYISSREGITVLMLSTLLIAVVLFMTELMSNVALITVFTPVCAGIALGMDMEMLHLLIPITMAASCAFMLPMATPPNAIVFASGYVKVSELARVGLILNIISILLLMLFAQYVIPLVFS